jgi:hypothetical protein
MDSKQLRERLEDIEKEYGGPLEVVRLIPGGEIKLAGIRYVDVFPPTGEIVIGYGFKPNTQNEYFDFNE